MDSPTRRNPETILTLMVYAYTSHQNHLLLLKQSLDSRYNILLYYLYINILYIILYLGKLGY
jgi:hypothetical protein